MDIEFRGKYLLSIIIYSSEWTSHKLSDLCENKGASEEFHVLLCVHDECHEN